MNPAGLIQSLETQVRRGLVGQDGLLRGLLTGMLANGHVLIEGVPGLAKTRSVKLLADACRMHFQRIQFTPDLLPADLIGTRIYNQQSGSFETSRGPIFANFLLADEINRAPAKVQSALLETMQERQVTIGRETHPLRLPFLVFATQNPIEQEGTYPLPEAQLDRFLLKLRVTYPSHEEEQEIVKMVIDEQRPPEIAEVLDHGDLLALQEATRQIFIEDRLVRYATDLVQATRRPGDFGFELAAHIEYGASPRASIALAQAARAVALLEGRDSVLPDDIKSVALPVLRHRVIPTYYASAERITPDSMVEEIVSGVPVP